MESVVPKLDPIDSASAQFIGIVLNWGLYGLLVAQTSTYFTTSYHDMLINKIIACTIFLLETLQTALLTYDLYEAFVLNFGDAGFLELIGTMWFTLPVLCGIVGWIAEIFYAYRIYKVSGSRKIGIIIVVLACIQLGGAIAEGFRSYSAQNMVKVRERGAPVATFPIILWVVAMVVCDLVIAVVMTYHLIKLNKEFQQSSLFVRKLMTLTIETGSATALTAILVVVLSIGKPDSEAYNIPAFLVGKLHSNSLLRVLNSRNRTQYAPDVLTLPASFDSHSVSRGGSRSRGEDEENSNV